jgi:hypothetical protein
MGGASALCIEEGGGQSIHRHPLKIYSRMCAVAFWPFNTPPPPLVNKSWMNNSKKENYRLLLLKLAPNPSQKVC